MKGRRNLNYSALSRIEFKRRLRTLRLLESLLPVAHGATQGVGPLFFPDKPTVQRLVREAKALKRVADRFYEQARFAAEMVNGFRNR